MRKFTSMLSLVALVASALFVSCAKEKTPDVVPAFPSNKPASFAPNNKGEYVWTYDSAYKWTAAKGGGFRENTTDKSILDYVIAPNMDWTVEIPVEARDYIQVRYGFGYNEDNYTVGHTVSGPRGANVVSFRTTPAARETEVVCVVEMIMGGERMPIATLTLAPQKGQEPEQPEQPETPAADYVVGGADFIGTITNWGDTYMNGSINYTIDLFTIAFDEESGDPAGMKMVRLDYSVPGDAEDASASNVAADNAYSFAPNTYTPGYFDGENQEIYGTIYAEMDYSTGLYTVTEPINDGVFSVSVAEDVYTITGELKSSNGKTIKIEYTGELDNANELSVLSRKSEARATVKHFFSTALKVAKR